MTVMAVTVGDVPSAGQNKNKPAAFRQPEFFQSRVAEMQAKRPSQDFTSGLSAALSYPFCFRIGPVIAFF